MALSAQGGSATYHPSGDWGGHWPIRTEMPQQATGNGKEAMEDPVDLQLIQDVYQPASSSDPHLALGPTLVEPTRQGGSRRAVPLA